MRGSRASARLIFGILVFLGVWGVASTAWAAPAVKLKVSTPSGAVAGEPLEVRVAAVRSGKTLRSYSGRVKLASSDPSATLPAPFRFGRKDRGVHLFKGVKLTRAGSQSVTATDVKKKAVRGTDRLGVVAGEVATLAAEGPAQATAGQAIQVTVTGSDRFGNTLGPLDPADVTLSISPDGACTASGCTAQVSGPHTITASARSVSDVVEVSVVPGPPQSIQIQLPEGSIAGEPFPVSAVVRDQFSNVIADPAPAVAFSIEPDGTCGATACQSTAAGKKTVTATSGGLSAFEKVGNLPGPLATIQVSSPAGATAPPAPVSSTSDYTLNPSKPTSKNFVAGGYDLYGNYTGDVTGSTNFTISPDGSCTAAACSGALPGAHTVTGTFGAATDTDSLTVDAYSDSFSMTCRGGNFDINGAMADGCEMSSTWAPNSNRATARTLAAYDDCTVNQVLATGDLLSDTRVHTTSDPAFSHSAGFMPLWFRTSAIDTAFCLTNMRMWLNVTGSSSPSCYSLTVISTPETNPGGTEFTASTTGGGAAAEIDYDNDTRFYFRIEKTCSAASLAEGATFSVLAEF